MYSYGQIALAITHAITGHTCTSKSTDYCHNCTQKCVINYTYCPHRRRCKEKILRDKWKSSRKSTQYVTVNRHKAMLLQVTRSEVGFNDSTEEERSIIDSTQ